MDLIKIGRYIADKRKTLGLTQRQLAEILGMSDRVIVMRHGRVMAEIDRDSKFFNQEDIMKASWGGKLS